MAYYEGAEKNLPDIINAISHLIEVMVANFGAWGTVGLLLILPLGVFLWRYYNEKKKDRRTDELLAEKDKTIQRLAEEARNYKVVIFKQIFGWTDEQVNLFIMKNQFEDGVSARRALEGEEPREGTDDKADSSGR